MERRTIFFVHVLLWTEIWFVCEGQFSFPSKKATQSQTYQSSTADRAIDSNPNTCSLVAVGNGSSAIGWWQGDLGDTFTVSSVTVTSGTKDGSSPEYLQNFAIYVGDKNNTDVGDSNLCYYFNNGSFVPTGVPLTLDCAPNPLRGRYVTIKRRGGFRQDAIGLCEVNIKYHIQLPIGYINILYLPTNQTGGFTDGSNVFHGSNLANDWNLQTCSEPINPGGTPKWYVDLQDFYAVTAVTAFNQDSSATFNSVPRYLSYFYVRVGNSTDLSSQTQCCYYNDIVSIGGNVTCTCQSTIIGRYISIERTGDDNPHTLVICEVLVQGYKANASWTSTVSSSSTATTISGSGSSALNLQSTLPTISSNETEPPNGMGETTTQKTDATDDSRCSAGAVFILAAILAAVVLGILFGICLVVIVILAIYIVRLQRQNKLNTINTEPQRDCKKLRRMPHGVGPTQTQSKTIELKESPYDEVTITAA